MDDEWAVLTARTLFFVVCPIVIVLGMATCEVVTTQGAQAVQGRQQEILAEFKQACIARGCNVIDDDCCCSPTEARCR